MPSAEISQDAARSGVRFRAGIERDQTAVKTFIAGIVFGGRVVIAWIGAFPAGQEKGLVAVDPIDNGRRKTHPAHQGVEITGMGIIAGGIAIGQQEKCARPVDERGKVDLQFSAIAAGRHHPTPGRTGIGARESRVTQDGDIRQTLQGAAGHLAGDRFGRIARLDREDEQIGLDALVRAEKDDQGLAALGGGLGRPAVRVMDGQTVFRAEIGEGLRSRCAVRSVRSGRGKGCTVYVYRGRGGAAAKPGRPAEGPA